MGEPARVLIVKMSSMGDVIHALPMVADIRRAMPGATIDWVVEEGFAALPRLHPAVDRVIPVALRRWSKALLSPAAWRELHAARGSVREHAYDRVIDCQGLYKSAWVARWAQGTTCGYDRDSAREPGASRCYERRFAVARTLHALERNRRLAGAALGYPIDVPPRFGLAVPPLGRPELRTLVAPAPYAVLLTNASRATKLWPAQSWQGVEAALARQDLRCLLVWGSPEEERATRSRAQAMREAHIVPRSPLEQLAALLAGARVVVGLDTGLTHLAAAVGVPTVGIFCDYDPALVGIVGDAPCASLGSATGGPRVDDVIAAIERVLQQREAAR